MGLQGAMATRRPLEPLLLPPYSFEDVPMASRDLQNSVIVKLNKREKWLSHLSSMLILCNEAAYRRTRKLPPGSKEGGGNAKPLGLEYMADRLDTDDPIWGYQARLTSPATPRPLHYLPPSLSHQCHATLSPFLWA